MHLKKVWKSYLNKFFIILIFGLLPTPLFSNFHMPYIEVRCDMDDCDKKYKITKTHFRKSNDSKDLLIYLPGGPGSPHLDKMVPIFPKTHLESLIGKIDLVYLSSPYKMPHPSSYAPARKSKDHYARIISVIEYYKKKTGKRIWLSGCSLGTNSLGNFLAEPEHQSLLHGAIFMCTNYNVDFRAKSINMPILIIHHSADACNSNPVSASSRLEEIIKKKNSNDTTFIKISGGKASGDPCSAQTSFHMFGTKAPEANDKILEYINNH